MGEAFSTPLCKPAPCVSRLRRCLSFCCFLVCVGFPAFALDPNQPLAQLHHTTWTAKDGLNGSVLALAQTVDGYLWVGTTDGLFRFDGISFERYKPERNQLPSIAVSTLLALPDGSLWIGYNAGGATHLKDGEVTNYSGAQGFPAARVRHFIQGPDGAIWAAVVGGFARLEGGTWKRIREDWNYPGRSAWNMLVDRERTMWVAAGQRIVFLPFGQKKFRDLGVETGPVFALNQLPDGSFLFFDNGHSDSLRTFRSPTDHRTDPLPTIKISARQILVDRDGAMWLTGIGLTRIPALAKLSGAPITETTPGLESLTEDQGLTDNNAQCVLEDREGNIWVGTRSGLERFRHRNLSWYPFPRGTGFYSLVAGDGGDVWTGSNGDTRMPVVRVQDRKEASGGPREVITMYRDQKDSIWVSSRNLFQQWKDGVFTTVLPPEPARMLQASTKDPIIASAITSDRAGQLWVAFGGCGEFRLQNGIWTFVPVLKDHPDWAASYAYTDAADRIWLVYGTAIAVVDHGKTRVFSAQDGLDIGSFKVIAARGEQIWVGGEGGLAFMKDGRFHTVQLAGGIEIGLVTGIASPPGDGLWLSGGTGILHIPEAEVQRAVQNPAYKVNFEVLDLESDLPEQLQRSTTTYGSGVIQSGDGMLWFPTRGGAARVNPKDIYRNPVPPPLSIRSIIADEKPYSVFGKSMLPALTRNLRIDYTALSLTIPQRVRFRYRLEGWEKEWQDAGARRQAFYGKLPPGEYTFRVIACNNDGVWNETGGTLKFSVAAAWFETDWFYASCLLASLAVLWLLFRVRMRQVARALTARFDERLAERTRLARDLHDTLLQTIQGSKMVADDALDGPSDPARLRRAIEQLSIWLGQATQEGRAALNSLRSSTVERNDLADALQRASATSVPPSMTATLSVSGEAREMHPIIRDEVYRIGHEAIRNASVHSGASRLEIELRYGKALVLRVSDNGVGINQEIAQSGRAGHFGLQGMRERAYRIGANFTLDSAPARGTTVTLTVPGTIVFQKTPGSALQKLRNAIRRLQKPSDL